MYAGNYSSDYTVNMFFVTSLFAFGEKVSNVEGGGGGGEEVGPL